MFTENTTKLFKPYSQEAIDEEWVKFMGSCNDRNTLLCTDYMLLRKVMQFLLSIETDPELIEKFYLKYQLIGHHIKAVEFTIYDLLFDPELSRERLYYLLNDLKFAIRNSSNVEDQNNYLDSEIITRCKDSIGIEVIAEDLSYADWLNSFILRCKIETRIPLLLIILHFMRCRSVEISRFINRFERLNESELVELFKHKRIDVWFRNRTSILNIGLYLLPTSDIATATKDIEHKRYKFVYYESEIVKPKATELSKEDQEVIGAALFTMSLVFLTHIITLSGGGNWLLCFTSAFCCVGLSYHFWRHLTAMKDDFVDAMKEIYKIITYKESELDKRKQRYQEIVQKKERVNQLANDLHKLTGIQRSSFIATIGLGAEYETTTDGKFLRFASYFYCVSNETIAMAEELMKSILTATKTTPK